MILRSVLAAVDFSDESRHALRWAAELAARYQAGLIALSVVDPLLAEAARIRLGQDLAAAETEPALRAFVRASWPPGAAVPPVACTVRVGHAADLILQTAEADGAGLIAMGTQGLGGFSKWILGSTTERVLRRTRLPVLAVPRAAAEGAEVRRILVAVDFSASSSAAMDVASELAARFSAPLVFAHAVEPIPVPPHLTPVMTASVEARAEEARGRLARLAARAAGPGEPDVAVTIGRTAGVIAKIAADRGASVIVMGLGGEPGPFASRPGTVAYRVLSSSPVPVLVVPSADRPPASEG